MDLKEYQKLGEKIHNSGIFVGCNIKEFARISQLPLEIAKQNDLTPESKVLDLGCGCCRTGYWFMEFLNPGNYYGIEPNKEMLNAGKEFLFPNLIDKKSPTFDNNDQFDLNIFNTQFDMIIAFSIWSHASKQQIEKVLKQLSEMSNKCSFIGTVVITKDPKQEYNGEEWVGKSHKSKDRGIVKYTPQYLQSICDKFNCTLEYLNHPQTDHQTWIKITNNE